MKRGLLLFLLFVSGGLFARATPAYVLKAGDFLDKGDWTSLSENNSEVLYSHGAVDKMAATVFDFPESGEFTVWLRAMDLKHMRSQRKVKVVINTDESLIPAPDMPPDDVEGGWVWNKIGRTQLKKGTN